MVKILNGIHLHLMDILAELLLGGLNVNRLYSRIHEIKRNYQEGRGFSIHENDTAIKCITRFQGLVKILKLVLGQDSEDV